MPKAIFKGSLSFGLVNIPIRVYPAVREKRVAFRLVHRDCKTPLQNKRWCPHCNREVPLREIVRGFPLTPDTLVLIEDEELQKLQLKTLRMIEIQAFVDAGEIDPLYFGTSYFLEPEEGGEKAYTLFREILSRTGKIAIGKVVMRNKEHVVAIRAYQNALLMVTLHYSDELLNPQELENLKKVIVVREQELKMAQMLIEQLAGEFRPEQFKDRYREAVLQLAKQKAEGQLVPIPRAKEVKATVDLMKALEASIQEIKKKKKAQAT